MSDDPVAAALAEIQERAGAAAAMDVDVLSAFSGVSVGGVIAASAVDVPRLLKAVKAALEQASAWDQEYARLEPSGADAVSNPGPGSYLVSGRLGALENCAEGLREAIAAALAGTQPGEH